ncbi:MAG TPA: hypothetical protein VMG60_09220 [Burkholderiaceae bacterium]|nr:hypothetical protein [Burkholderiaceae bacterium]
MNMPAPSAPATPAPPRAEAAACDKARPQETVALAQSRQAFQSALRARISQREDDGDAQSDGEQGAPFAEDGGKQSLCEPAPAFTLPGALTQPLLRRALEAPPGRSATAETTTTGTRASLEAALNANVAPSVTQVGASDPAAVWEASVSEPNSIPVDIRAIRAERSGPQQMQPTWTVGVSSSRVDAEILARHVPRLNERLRKQGIGFSHVREDRDEDEDDDTQ